MRFAAAIALRGIDPRTSGIVEELARTSGCGEVRIQAALALPEPIVLRHLVNIVHDRREHEHVRYDVGVVAMNRDKEVGRQKLTKLAQSRVSRRMKAQIARLLQQCPSRVPEHPPPQGDHR